MTQNTDLVAEKLLAEKIDVVLVMLNSDALKDVVKKINLDHANLVAIVTDGYGKKNFTVGGKKIPVTKFATIHSTMSKYKKIFWLISGGANSDNLLKIKKFLMMGGVPEGNIINFDIDPQISGTWLANLRYLEKNGAYFFITGNEYAQADVNLNLIPTSTGGGVNLAEVGQTLRQSYLTAKYVFKHTKPGTIKFVLIGLMPHSLRYNNAQNFLNATRNLQYAILFNEPTADEEFLLNLLKVNFKKFFKTVTAEQADINFDGIRATRGEELSVKAIADWRDTAKFFTPDLNENNSRIVNDYAVLKDYIKLCLANGAKPVGMILPFAPIVRKKFDSKLLSALREMIHKLEESYDFTCIDMFDLNVSYGSFCDMTYMNETGQISLNAMISLRLWQMNFLATEDFCNMNYNYFQELARRAPKNEYIELLDKVLKVSVQQIRRKKKIKLGFAMLEAAHWCGKDLYDFFANDDRFEVTVFLSLDFHKNINDLVKEDFTRGVEQLKSHDLNIVAVGDFEANIVEQDILIFLTPYLPYFAMPFQVQSMTPKTLITHVPYAFDSSFHVKYIYSYAIFLVAWKIFFSSNITFDLYKEKCVIGAPHGLYAGYPRMDIFFKQDTQFQFEWKMTRPDAKKIIWAPHHSIKGTPSIQYATFQWNYKFIYEFAKAHPETSWVVKPHPWLLYTAVTDGVFETAEAFNEYLQAWNDLPNAQVIIGGYYQDIFATSDGMIHDCGSFISEYQYINKPMIYLTRDTQKHNELGEEILNISYCVNGQNLEGIATMIQRVIMEGDDYRATERRELFNKHLNYPKANGMLASEFIYHSIADELKEVSE